MRNRLSVVSLAAILLAFPLAVWPSKDPSASSARIPSLDTRDDKKRAAANDDDTQRTALVTQAENLAHKAKTLRKKQLARDLYTASQLLAKSARLFLAARDFDKAANAYLQNGEILSTFSQYGKARQAFHEALKLGKDPELRCRALSRIARTYATTGPNSSADQYSEQALTVCANLSESAQADSLEARGEALDSAGEHAKAAGYLRKAKDLFAHANDDEGQAQALLILSYTLFSSGEREQALQSAGQALGLWSGTNNHLGIAQVRAALGIFAVTTGEFETAQCNYSLAYPLFHATGDKDEEAMVLNGWGYVSRELGDWQKSVGQYRKARTIFASAEDLLGEREAIAGIGKGLAAQNTYRELLPLYEAGLRLAQRAHSPVLVASALADIASAYQAGRKYKNAERFYRRSLDAYHAADHLYGEGDILIRIGQLQAVQGHYLQALDTLERANQLKQRTGQLEEVAKIGYEKAAIFRHLRRLDAARTAIEKTIEIVESQRVTIAHFDSRASYFASVRRYYALYIQVLMLLHQQEPGKGFDVEAFNASERSKVRSLLDLLVTSAHDAPCEELLRRQLARPNLMAAGVVDPVQPAIPPTPTLTVQQVQEEIEDEDTILLEYSLGDEKSHVWAAGRNDFKVHELPPAAKISQLVERLRETLTPPQHRVDESASDYQARRSKVRQENQRLARRLSQLILAPVNLGRAKRILIVSDGALQYVPFAALPAPGLDPNQLLISRFEVDVLPSASVLGTMRKAYAKRPPPTATAIILADPVFEPDDPRIPAPVAHSEKPKAERPMALARAINEIQASQYIPRLPASRSEANAIAGIFRSADPDAVHLAIDFDASRDFVLQGGLAGYRLVHFATHGVVDTHQPEMSGLILSLIDRKGRKQDGYLRLGDIYKLKLSADLVVLSSCDSALGRDLGPEGTIGLPRGFLYAGAKSVIASLWKVSDEATASLMSSMYRRIHRGEPPSSALRNAQLEMMREPQWSDPHDWAGFVLQGEYR